MNSNGKKIRLSRIFDKQTHKAVVIPLDDDLISGPEGGLRDIRKEIQEVVAGGADAILGFYGLFAHNYDLLKETSGVINITASTIRSSHTRKVLVGSVEQGVKLGMDAISIHVNISSKYEGEMLKIFGEISRECERLGMPLLAHLYPRSEKGDGEDEYYFDLLKEHPEKYTELVRHCTRIGVDLGADIVKVPFTGSKESFQTVIASASGVPVIMAGGPKVSTREILTKVYDAVSAGAAGVAIGRNVFNHTESTNMVIALREVVHEGTSVDKALKLAGLSAK